ncbi:class I SAM-dependent methyltransferase [Aeromonas simiae]|uniref:class I SAM-dependent methyltransferase n=1 Tax=Aeromonas simiae TaxID=218936 RepID=UPI0005A8BF1B|nr:methyltransferase domain-containing protein [Aeromonas simiae]
MPLRRSEPQIRSPASWHELPMGDWIAGELQHRLDVWCPHLFGYHLLKLGALSGELSCTMSTIRHQLVVAPEGRLATVRADLDALPIRCGSVDACLLAHTLDFSRDPHQVLREVERVLTDDGWVIVSGSNPLSLLGMGRSMPWLRRRLPWSGRMFTPRRIIDWLKLLGFEVMFDERFGYGWGSGGGWWYESLGHDYCRHLASTYIIAARKRRAPLLPIQKRWALPRSLATPGMARVFEDQGR